MDTLENELALWIDDQISDLLDTLNLVYLEYNTSNKLEFSCSFFGYAFTDATSFDIEDINHLDVLSSWEWASGVFEFRLGSNELGSDSGSLDEMEILEKALSESKELAKQIKESDLTVVYGLHEASPRRFNLRAKSCEEKSRRGADKIYYYELHFDYSGSPYIESYDLFGIDEQSLLDSDKIEKYSSDNRILLVLQKNAKLKDLLNFYRGWLVCSQRLVELFKEYTSNLQVFPATVQRQLNRNSESIEDYSVVNLYEKIDCIGSKWLVASFPGTNRATFDPGKGYKFLHEKVAGKDIFRVNVPDHRLLVSQRFRDEIESRKISGISWLKREAE